MFNPTHIHYLLFQFYCNDIKHVFNYTKQIHNIFNYIYLLCFSCIFRCYLHLHQGELCVLYLKPHAGMQLLSMVIAAYRHVLLSREHKVLPDEGVSNTGTGRRNTVNICN